MTGRTATGRATILHQRKQQEGLPSFTTGWEVKFPIVNGVGLLRMNLNLMTLKLWYLIDLHCQRLKIKYTQCM